MFFRELIWNSIAPFLTSIVLGSLEALPRIPAFLKGFLTGMTLWVMSFSEGPALANRTASYAVGIWKLRGFISLRE